jgi:two-component system, NtrC family, nitrogen regulation sensor histidine kinase NtrY
MIRVLLPYIEAVGGENNKEAAYGV